MICRKFELIFFLSVDSLFFVPAAESESEQTCRFCSWNPTIAPAGERRGGAGLPKWFWERFQHQAGFRACPRGGRQKRGAIRGSFFRRVSWKDKRQLLSYFLWPESLQHFTDLRSQSEIKVSVTWQSESTSSTEEPDFNQKCFKRSSYSDSACCPGWITVSWLVW